jgi:hypothetical protein
VAALAELEPATYDIDAETREITPHTAKHILIAYRYIRQRPVSPKRVDSYASEMQAGRFDPGTLVFAKPANGPLQLIDGQHRLNALVLTGIAQRFVIVTHYVTDQADVDRKYARIDIGKMRSMRDTLTALGTFADIGLESSKDARAVVGAVRLILGRFNSLSRPISREEIAATVEEFGAPARGYFASIDNGEKEMYQILRRAPVTAVGLLTFERVTEEPQLEQVREFWHGLAMSDGLLRGDPRWHLMTHLRAYGLSHAFGSGRKDSRRYQAMYTAKCWNFWSDGKMDVKFVKVSDETAPLVLKRTTRFAA